MGQTQYKVRPESKRPTHGRSEEVDRKRDSGCRSHVQRMTRLLPHSPLEVFPSWHKSQAYMCTVLTTAPHSRRVSICSPSRTADITLAPLSPFASSQCLRRSIYQGSLLFGLDPLLSGMGHPKRCRINAVGHPSVACAKYASLNVMRDGCCLGSSHPAQSHQRPVRSG